MATTEDNGFRHPIGVVSRRTGLSASALRAWERRYGAVSPERSKGGQRLYSDADLERLSLLKRLVDEGRSISQVANLPLEDLLELAGQEVGTAAQPVPHHGATPPQAADQQAIDAQRTLERALRFTEEMRGESLQRTLTRAAVVLRPEALIGQVLVPLLTRIGETWKSGQMGAAQEHLASGVVRRFLEWLIDTAEVGQGAPVLLTATPQGHRHEFGALIAGTMAAEIGWRAVCLGPDLPADEIAAAAKRTGAAAVAISAVHGQEPGRLVAELTRLRQLLPDDVRLLAGGRGIEDVRSELTGSGVEVAHDLSVLPRVTRAS